MNYDKIWLFSKEYAEWNEYRWRHHAAVKMMELDEQFVKGSYIESELEAIERTIKILELIENSEMRIEILLDIHNDSFPLCSNAYYRKQKCAYASVCDCCIFAYHFHLWSCKDILMSKDEKVWKSEWVEIFLEYLQRLKNELS